MALSALKWYEIIYNAVTTGVELQQLLPTKSHQFPTPLKHDMKKKLDKSSEVPRH